MLNLSQLHIHFIVSSRTTSRTGPIRTITWPGLSYYAILLTSLVLVLGAVAATFGVLKTNTAITTTRFQRPIRGSFIGCRWLEGARMI